MTQCPSTRTKMSPLASAKPTLSAADWMRRGLDSSRTLSAPFADHVARPVGGASVDDQHLDDVRVALGIEGVEAAFDVTLLVQDRDHHRHRGSGVNHR